MHDQPPHSSGFDLDDRRFFRRALIILGLLALMYFLWMLAGTLLLVFAAILIAVILRAFSSVLEHHAHVPDAISFYVALLLVALAFGAFGYFFGAQLQMQLADLLSKLPGQIEGFAAQLGIQDPMSEIESQLDDGWHAQPFSTTTAGFGYTLFGSIA